MPRVAIQTADFDLAAEIASLRAADLGVGAVASFIGTVRDRNGAVPGEVSALELEHYPGMTEASIESMIDAAHARFDIRAARVVHRVGPLQPGDQIVLVAVSSAHRGQAFQACEFLMDYLKTQAPFARGGTLGRCPRQRRCRTGALGPEQRQRRARPGMSEAAGGWQALSGITAVQCAAVAGGAAIGALLRWFAGLALNALHPLLPLGTLLVNCLGGLAIGVALVAFHRWPDATARLFVVTGLLGGFTTFSAFSAESLGLLQQGQAGAALLHSAAHVFGALACAALGHAAARALVHAA